MSFADLIKQVQSAEEQLQKSLPAGGQDDKKIAAAADAGGADDGAGVGGDDGASGGGDGGDGDGAGGSDGKGAGDGSGDGDGDDDMTLTKSFMFKLEDGTEVEAFDGTAMLKSFRTALAAADQRTADATAAATAAAEAVTEIKAGVSELMSKSISLMEKQGEMIKSLQADVQRLSSQGRGRQSVITVRDEPTLRKSLTTGDKGGEGKPLEPGEFLAKCLSAQAAGRISASDTQRAESYINAGVEVPKDIVARVLA